AANNAEVLHMKQRTRIKINQLVVLCVIFLLSITTSSATPQGEQHPLLVLGNSIVKELKSDEIHVYQIAAEADQYLQVVVIQQGIDVVVSVFDPSGKKIYEVDSPYGTAGQEPVYLITASKGLYRLEVRSLKKTEKPGKYEVKLEQLRPSRNEDKPRVA